MLVLTGARLIDGNGQEPVDDVTVVIEDNLIASVGKKRAPRGAEVLDLEGRTLLPGLIDAHTHLGLIELSNSLRLSVAEMAAHIFRNCELALMAGFTTARDAGGIDGGIARVTSAGLVPGPRIFPSGPILCQTGGHGDLRLPFADHHHNHALPGLIQTAAVCDGPDEVRHQARLAFRRGATQIKVCVSGGVVSLTDKLEDTQFTIEELKAAVEEAEVRDTYVMAHAHGLAGIRNGLEAGIASFEHATFLDEETANQMAEAGAAIVPTLAVTRLLADEFEEWGIPPEVLPRLEGIEKSMTRAIEIARSAGVAVGSGSDLLGRAQNRRGLELVLKAQILGAMEAIISATKTNARILRADDRLGTVEAGKLADLIVLDFDPLSKPELFDDPNRVIAVLKDGAVVKTTI